MAGPPRKPDPGSLPDEENEFADTPTTAVSGQAPLPEEEDDLTDERAAQLAELADAPASSAYADAVISTVEADLADLFTAEPPTEGPVVSLAEPLPEMAAEIWQAGVRAL